MLPKQGSIASTVIQTYSDK